MGPPALPPPTEEEPQYETRWYGWQTLIADGVSLGLVVGGGYANSGGVVYAGIMTYFLAPPIIHFAHGHVGKGFLSMGLRVGMPIALGLGLAAASNCSSGGYCGLGEFALGFGIGMAGASAIDSAAIAWEKVPAEPSVAVVPMLGRDHAGLAISGAF